MFSSKILTNRVIRARTAEDVMHSTGYAQVKSQNVNMMNKADSKAFGARKSIDEQRKYVRGYKNSRIMNEFYGVKRAQTSVLRPHTSSNTQASGAGTVRENSGVNRQKASIGANGARNPVDAAVRRAQFSVSTPHRFGRR